MHRPPHPHPITDHRQVNLVFDDTVIISSFFLLIYVIMVVYAIFFFLSINNKNVTSSSKTFSSIEEKIIFSRVFLGCNYFSHTSISLKNIRDTKLL